MHRFRGKLTYSNVISTLCLVLILGGGTAYAASELGKESVDTKQLAKGAVTPSKLAKGAKKALTGAKGATGPQGAAGPRGAAGPQGATGSEGKQGKEGKEGAPGKNLTAETPLASGQTETGVFSASGSGSGTFPVGIVVFVQPLPAPLGEEHVFDLGVGETNSHCSGPGHAAPGFFCAYDVVTQNVAHNSVSDPSTGDDGASKDGTQIYYTASGTGAAYGYGTWAVTAP